MSEPVAVFLGPVLGRCGVTLDGGGHPVTVRGVRIRVGEKHACALRIAGEGGDAIIEDNLIEVVPGMQGVSLDGFGTNPMPDAEGPLVRLARRIEGWWGRR